ncbi:TniQ family protein [Streptomyces sp. 900105755]
MPTTLPPQPQPPRAAAARPGPVRLAPLQGETNLSYLDRLADRYRLGVRDLIPSLLQSGGVLFKGYRADGEVYLNAEARARISAFCRVPEEILRWALPAWTAQDPVSPDGAAAAGLFRFGRVVPAAGEGCRLCTAARTGRAKPARLYLQPHTRICPRHQRWMLGTHWIDGAPAASRSAAPSAERRPRVRSRACRHRLLVGAAVARGRAVAQPDTPAHAAGGRSGLVAAAGQGCGHLPGGRRPHPRPC